MVYVTLTHTRRTFDKTPQGVFSRLQQFLAQIKQRRELQQLLRRPDYELRDIGLLRSEIAKAANRSLWSF